PVRLRDVLRARQPLPRPGRHHGDAAPQRRLLLRPSVTIEQAIGDVLARLSNAQIEALAAACRKHQRPHASLGKVATGGTPAAHDATSSLAAAWQAPSNLTGEGGALALLIGLQARRDADARRSRPVWTGPRATGKQRLTAGVLHELLCAATQRILLVCFAA